MSDINQRRHHYLATMGVTHWLPRTVLTGAKASADWVNTFLYEEIPWDEVASSPAAGAEDVKTAPVTPASLHLSPEPIKTQVEGRQSQRVALPPSTSEGNRLVAVEITQRQKGRPVQPFKLCFWVFEDVWVVDSLPYQRGRQQSEAYSRLCAHLVRALGFDSTPQTPAYTLTWPMLAGAHLDQGIEQARIAVAHKLSKYQQQQTLPKVLILLGEAAAQLVIQREEPLEQLRGLVFNYTAHIQALASLSLTQMLNIPDCKQEVWQDLQPFYRFEPS